MRCLGVVVLFLSLTEVLSLKHRIRLPSQSQQHNKFDIPQDQPAYTEFYYKQTLDHFNFFTQPQTYQQRYLVSTTYFQPGAVKCAPMIFYTGNEGDITWFYNNSLFVTETLAKEFGALVVFAEHRYYGLSLPFGASSFTKANIAYLTSEQALADYAQLIPVLKSKYQTWGCPVIAVGGSYGGMLAAWFRIKYPHIADMALAASAPILQFEGTGVREEIYNEIITNDFAMADFVCPFVITSAFDRVQTTPLANLTYTFRLCRPLEDVSDLVNWLVNGFGYMAMADYPYPANFLQPMPAWPVNLTCSLLETPDDMLNRLFNGISVYYNYTGTVQCFNTSVFTSDSSADVAWDYQACTEMVFPISANGVDDMFPPAPFDLDQLTKYCQKTWGVTPRPHWITTNFGGRNITAASNIIFSNGVLDPWSGGGVTKTLSPTLVAIVIDQAAHHLDLRGPNPADPPSVTAARAEEINLIHKWLGI